MYEHPMYISHIHVYGYGTFCLGGSQLRLSDAGGGEVRDARFAAETVVLEYQGAFPQALTLSRGARVTLWRLRRLFF